MPLSPGTRIGVYEIVAPIGSGGMGDVYRAHDTKLRRDVAIKVLPHLRAGDPDHVARFAREARLLAALNHPRIATIHGFEDTGGVHALAMELVEGPTLAEHLLAPQHTGGLPIAAALKIAGQIAEAIEAAHEKGVIHRDLKPANIKLDPDGNIKVLDFGIAKALSTENAGSGAPPTVTATEIGPGKILGTPSYMSPQQARGQAIDKRTDIWSFGCVLHEMLTGQMAFTGGTTSDTMAAVLQREPDWSALPAHTPSSIRSLLRRCLEKDPNRRLHDIADARIEIDDVLAGRSQDSEVASAAPPRRWLAPVLGTMIAAPIVSAIVFWPRPLPPAPELRLEITTAETRSPAVAISPDGRTIAFVARSEGQWRVWLRQLDSSIARPLAETNGARLAFWSPDSKSIGFFADTLLKRMDIDSGNIKTLASGAPVALGGTWNRDGTILFAANPGGPIQRISADGGESVVVTEVESPRQRGHAAPQFLPDGRHFLYLVSGTPDARGIYVGQLGDTGGERLFDADSYAVYSTTGHLLFVRGGNLLAQAFDAGRLEVTGSPFAIAGVGAATTVSASAAGPIAYRTGARDQGQRQLIWIDRSGRETNKVVYQDASALGPSLSPDARRVAVYRFADGNMDLWSYDVQRRAWDRLTFDLGDEIYPLWSRDGARMFFGAVRSSIGGSVDLYQMAMGGAEHTEVLLLSTTEPKFPTDVSPGGRFLLYEALSSKNGLDLWGLALDGDRKPIPLVQTEFNEGFAQFSPNGKWFAYQSNKTARYEIYLRPFPGPGAEVRVSSDGGAQVRWNPNGKELFYVGADDRLMAVPIDGGGATAEIGTAVGLFTTNIEKVASNIYRQQYDVAPDGRSFIVNTLVGDNTASPISVILNWRPKP